MSGGSGVASVVFMGSDRDSRNSATMKSELLRFVKIMSLSIEQITQNLESENSRDRMIALANLRDIPAEEAVPLIKKVLNDESLQIRSMAVFALGIKQTDECFPILLNILETEKDYGIRADAAGALGYLEDIRAFEPLVRTFYEDTDWLVRFSAAVALGNLKDPRAKEVLLQALDSEEVVVQQAAIAALGEIKAIEAVEAILQFAQSEDWLVRQRLSEALGNLPSEKSVSALRYLEKDNNSNVAESARISLERLNGTI
ncbi:HEAT repeat domain-containing protein [Leptolyngbya sp. NIES-2104]|uniref:HEAT repeat domain-containing protein n=1 Tax=Leptolyngbya sp. NIES-2104 TaxID=1552121 RepID=UPI0030D97EC5